LADFDSYLQAHDKLYSFLQDPKKSASASLRNIARSGIFAADRAVADYAKNIWQI
ncbi:MAG: glycogen/starch/alpha-glucan phosphorylase, partial [Oscillospiraceae bacterium]